MAGTTGQKTAKLLPTHQNLIEFISNILPPHPRDVVPVYHSPRYTGYNPTTTLVHDIVLSTTPTPGVYQQLTHLTSLTRPTKPVCFLHRPFNLDRHALPKGTLVQACHKRFDELMTVGWNTAVAENLGLDVQSAVCIQGYKGDPDRRIGLVGRLNVAKPLKVVHGMILQEFDTGEVVHPPQTTAADTLTRAVAIMNAFGPDEIDRAVKATISAGFIDQTGHANLIYLTGESKELGLATVQELFAGMTTICVGHRAAEEWGIKHVDTCIKQTWSGVHIHMVFEEDQIPSNQA